MTGESNPLLQYSEREKKYNEKKTGFEKQLNILSLIRLMFFLLSTGLLIWFFYSGYYFVFWSFMVISFMIFILLIVKYENIKSEKSNAENIISINRKSRERVEEKWNSFEDNGIEYADDDHPYTGDLDIFGQGSLFQWINCTNTSTGRDKLGEYLSRTLKTKKDINDRQIAIEELANKISWRQNFQSQGMSLQNREGHAKELIDWGQKSSSLIKNRWLKLTVRYMPVLTISFLIASFGFKLLPQVFGLFFVVLQIIITKVLTRNSKELFNLTDRLGDVVKKYRGLLIKIEDESFESSLLNDIKRKLYRNDGEKSSSQISRLEKIVDFMNLRLSIVHFVINILFLWDIQCIFMLERWKIKSGIFISHWLDVIGSFEALSSLSIVRFDNPSWIMADVSDSQDIIKSSGLGHPLIPANDRVVNDISLQEKGNIILITGSNMSGKSTMLRTCGISLLFAQIGLPLCANSFSCSIMPIYSSMRINDNIEKNISSFYAELLRIKTVIEESRKGGAMFFLLDEIFKGTNSRDRHIGARSVLRTLSNNGAMGLVSTHDLELTELENLEGFSIENYFFRENYINDKINFDYKMRKGISDTSDAIYLMKMVGIEADDEK